MHIYDRDYPVAAGAYHQPEPNSSVADYRREMSRVGISRAVVVQPTAYGTDNSCLLHALSGLKPNARGIAIVDRDISDSELARLAQGGVVGLRAFLMHGGLMSWDSVQALAPRVAAFGWHIDICFHSNQFVERLELLLALPTEVVIEHFGFDIADPEGPSMNALLRLLDGGRAWVKLSSPYYVDERSDERGYRDVDEVARRLIQRAPERCVWGSNWPNAGFNALIPKPDPLRFLNRIDDWTSDPKAQRQILVENPERLYGFAPRPRLM